MAQAEALSSLDVEIVQSNSRQARSGENRLVFTPGIGRGKSLLFAKFTHLILLMSAKA
jgi:hypothetical protein